MKLRFLYTFSLLIALIALSSNIKDDEKSILKTSIPIYEKVWLHFDKPYYYAGENIWFKAYLLNAQTNMLTDSSTNLYVELISPESIILSKRIVYLEKGMSHGDFYLSESLPSGTYTIRAYTSWIKNFEETFIFQAKIQIENVHRRNKLLRTNKTNNEPAITFFPEGGALVDGVESWVGFKAIKYDGLGCDVSGWVITEFNDTVTSFKSLHLGMGTFNLTPKKGISYYAVGSFLDNIPFKVPLPISNQLGFTIHITEKNNDEISLSISTNPETLKERNGTKIRLVGKSHQLEYSTDLIKLDSLVKRITYPKSKFPRGIAIFTLYDNSNLPCCERLFYISKNDTVAISIKPDKKYYSPREKITISIRTENIFGQGIPANLSISVLDSRIIQFDKNSASTFTSWLFLESEIKGFIEQPSYYFDKKSSDRLIALDNLLLTQGWRNFVWQQKFDSLYQIEYPIERGLTLKGKARGVFMDRPLKKINVLLLIKSWDTTSQSFSAITDSLGSFYFNSLKIFGKSTVILSFEDNKKKPFGKLNLDPIYTPVSTADKTNNNTYPLDLKAFRKEYALRLKYMKSISVPDTIVNSPNSYDSYKNNRNQTPIHGKAEEIYYINQKGQTRVSSISEVVRNSRFLKVRNGRIMGNSLQGWFGNGAVQKYRDFEPMFLIDGMIVDQDMVLNLPIEIIDKVEVLSFNQGVIYGPDAANGVVAVFTKDLVDKYSSDESYNTIKIKVQGYYIARTFYSPEYNLSDLKYDRPDYRTTIFWNPSVSTDSNGEATVTFYNTDIAKSFNLRLEGITSSGNPISKEIDF